jgi:SAM-dependent methyltransferase
MWSWRKDTSADYDRVYESAEYEEAQVNPLKAAVDPEEFLRHSTYAPFFREIPMKTGDSLLDVGCGVGRFLIAARSVGWKTRGIDVSKKAVEIGVSETGLELSCESLEELQAAKNRFHAVTAFEVLEHVREPVELIRAAFELLHDGGWFFCTVPNRESRTVQTIQRPDWLPPVHLQYYTRLAIERLLERAGGRNIRTGFITNRRHPRRLRGKVRYALERLFSPQARVDPLGIWGMAQRGPA